MQTAFCEHTRGLLRYSECPLCTLQLQLGAHHLLCPAVCSTSTLIHTAFFCLTTSFLRHTQPLCPHHKSPRYTWLPVHTESLLRDTPSFMPVSHRDACWHISVHRISSWEHTAFFVPPGMWDLGFPAKDRTPSPPAVEVQSQHLDHQGSPGDRQLSAFVPPAVLSTHTPVGTAQALLEPSLSTSPFSSDTRTDSGSTLDGPLHSRGFIYSVASGLTCGTLVTPESPQVCSLVSVPQVHSEAHSLPRAHHRYFRPYAHLPGLRLLQGLL